MSRGTGAPQPTAGQFSRSSRVSSDLLPKVGGFRSGPVDLQSRCGRKASVSASLHVSSFLGSREFQLGNYDSQLGNYEPQLGNWELQLVLTSRENPRSQANFILASGR